MKFAKLFFRMLYIQLVVQFAVVPIMMIYGSDDSYSDLMSTLLLVCMILLGIIAVAVQIIGCTAAVNAVKMYFNSEIDNLNSAWKLLKLKTIPFYILNFIYCFFYCVVLIGASRGMIVFALFPLLIPIWHACALILQSGFYGIANVMVLRRQKKDFSAVYYFLQVIPVLDVISTILILHKIKNRRAEQVVEQPTE